MKADLKAQLEKLLCANGHRASVGFVETAVPSVHLFWADAPIARAPLSYAPGIAVIVSGRKIGFFDERRMEYGPGQYLAVGLPLFFECETFASYDEPMIGLFFSVEPERLLRLAGELEASNLPAPPPQPGLGIEPLTIPDQIKGAVARLIGHLLDPTEAAILALGTLKEIFFHALQDRHGRVLLSQIHRARDPKPRSPV